MALSGSLRSSLIWPIIALWLRSDRRYYLFHVNLYVWSMNTYVTRGSYAGILVAWLFTLGVAWAITQGVERPLAKLVLLMCLPLPSGPSAARVPEARKLTTSADKKPAGAPIALV